MPAARADVLQELIDAAPPITAENMQEELRRYPTSALQLLFWECRANGKTPSECREAVDECVREYGSAVKCREAIEGMKAALEAFVKAFGPR